MPIATIGVLLTVSPGDALQIVHAKDEYEIVDDRSPFTLRVAEILREDGTIIGVAGPVIDGHPRYLGKIATLTLRTDNSHWESDMFSGTNFKVGPTIARRIPAFPLGHPEGTEVDGYPFIIRYGRVDATA